MRVHYFQSTPLIQIRLYIEESFMAMVPVEYRTSKNDLTDRRPICLSAWPCQILSYLVLFGPPPISKDLPVRLA